MPFPKLPDNVDGNYEKHPAGFCWAWDQINVAIYQQCILKDVEIPWSQQHFEDRRWTLQQDWALAHSARSTMEFYKTNKTEVWNKTLYLSNPPDLNLMNFMIWSILEQKTWATNHSTTDLLKKQLRPLLKISASVCKPVSQLEVAI